MIRDKIFLCTMGDNCTDFLERIALEYEKEGKDLIVVSNYLYEFSFKHVDEIHFLNWNIACRSWDDIADNIYDKWIAQEREDRIEDSDNEDNYFGIDEATRKMYDEIANGGIKYD